MVADKIAGFKKQKDAAAGLVADAIPLRIIGRFGQQQPRAFRSPAPP
jgi:hypothetical protein